MSDARSDVRCFGRAVVQMRELRNMSREQLAKKSKIKLAVLSAIEEGTISGGTSVLRRSASYPRPWESRHTA